jgi:acetoin utilization protein AcuC
MHSQFLDLPSPRGARLKAFLYSPDLEKHPYPPYVPFKTQRAGKTRGILQNMGLLSGGVMEEVVPQPATRTHLETFHTPKYIEALIRTNTGSIDPDALQLGLGSLECPVFPGLYEHACLAAGATLRGAELILSGQAEIAFNPSGGFHHAHPAFAGGFCYVNDIVLACLALTEAGKRVGYLDIDVHHCDGVQDAFYARSDVLCISLHESGVNLFPGTGFVGECGKGDGEGYTVNIPLPMETYDEIYMKAVNEIVYPLLQSYAPDVLVLEIGADALAGDPLAHLRLTNNVYVEIIEGLLRLGKPILATGGGGYNVENAVRAWALSWMSLCGEKPEHDMSIGMGGVMLESVEWAGGLQDRRLAVEENRAKHIRPAVQAAIEAVKEKIFPFHGL